MQFDITPYRFLEWDHASFCCGDYVRLVLNDYLGATLRPEPHAGKPTPKAAATSHTLKYWKLNINWPA